MKEYYTQPITPRLNQDGFIHMTISFQLHGRTIDPCVRLTKQEAAELAQQLLKLVSTSK